jgi:hypothetical protein
MKKRITIHDVKQALFDERFRDSLPEELQEDVQKFLKNPTCGCNTSVYINIMKKGHKQLLEYFPTKVAPTDQELKEEVEQPHINNWQVINCTTHELSEKLRELGPGRKQIDIARWQDQVTVIVNHLDGV